MPRIKQQDKTTQDKRGGTTPRQFMLDKLKQSALTAKDAEILGYQPFTENESCALGLQRAGVGFKLPYCTYDGKPLPMFRYRYAATTIDSGLAKGAKLRKYDQPPATDPEIYFPRLVSWVALVADPTKPIIITEGELKAACATKAGHPCIGVGGVYSFGRKARHQTLLPALQMIKWKDRKVYIAYDSDAVTNPKVLIAENRLARALTDAGAIVHVVRLPSSGDEKVGLDDYICNRGVAEFEALLAGTEGWADAEPLHTINAEAVYIANPSMVVLFPKENEKVFTTHAVTTFVNEVYAHRGIMVTNEKTGNVTRKSAAAEWIKWPSRNELKALVYEPGQPTIFMQQLNAWQGWGATPIAGDIAPWHTLVHHVFKHNPEHLHWFLCWLAYPLQHPGTKLKTACVFWSVENGTGKSLIGYTVGRIYGDNFSEVNKPDLAGSFNGWAVNKQFIMGEEITGGSGRDMADVLKNMITGTNIQVNVKYKPTYHLRNSLNYFFTSNHQDAFFINDKDRRYFIQELPPPLPLDFYTVTYDSWYKSQAGINALFHFLLHYDISGFNPQAPAPHTRSRNEMVGASRSEMGAWVQELKDYPDNILRVGAALRPERLMSTQDLMELYAPEGTDRKNKSERAMAIALKELGFKQVNKGEAIDVGHGVRKRVWAVRDAKDAELGLKAGSEQYQAERKFKGGQPKYSGGKK